MLKKQSLWVPTLPGWLLLVAFCLATTLLTGRGLYSFLAVNHPKPGAELLVVEGWLGSTQLDQAVAACRQGTYQKILTTGGSAEVWIGKTIRYNYAELAARYLETHCLDGTPVTAVPAPASAQDRTYLSAVMVRHWLEGEGQTYNALDLFSSGTHARRSHRLYRMALGPDVAIGVIAAQPSDYNANRWWETSSGAKSVLNETIAWLWTVCCFRPGPPGSHEELWAVPAAAGRE
ncbi:ElyC/SanA/YdcF family protein [Desulfurivibrio sp. D14AmB]|uniref:ElyC/SanA/YdcF family protein n=1 Tax=Desulfurivibrio sp. D14AmB TaxID=3374370 RepID=UPI00376EEF70